MLEIKHLHKTYITKGAPPVHALRDVSVKLEHTGMVFVLGKSGSGKSTFLNVVGGLDKYDSGEIIIKGKSSSEFAGSDFDSYRNTYLGFIFQEYNLINEFTVGRNIALAMELQSRKAGPEDINNILKLVDLEGLADRLPLQISGGQRQRVAIARALVKNPEIIMADEPTGALDSNTGAAIFQTLQNLSRTRLVLIVSHDREFAERYGDRIIEFSDGRIISDMIKKDDAFVEESDESEDIKKVEEIIDVTKKAGLSEQHVQILTKLLEEKKAEEPRIRQKRRRGTFIDTKEEMLTLRRANDSPFKLIKSSLPQRDAFKMATSSMKHKKVRLFFSIFLSVIAVTLFGFSNVVGGFNSKAMAKSVARDYGYNSMVVSKHLTSDGAFSGGYYGYGISFNEDELNKMKNITNDGLAKFYSVSDTLPLGSKPVDSKHNEDYYKPDEYSFPGRINGMVTTDDFKKIGIDVPSVYGREPEADDEILITNFMAETCLLYGLKYRDGYDTKTLEPEKINDILSYKVVIGGNVLKIVGIVNMPIERYKDLKLNSTKDNASKTLKDEFHQRKAYDLSFIFGRPGLAKITGVEEYQKQYTNYCFEYDISGIERGSAAKYNYYTVGGTKYSDYSGMQSIYLGKDGSTQFKEPKKGEVIINISSYLLVKDRLGGNHFYEDGRYKLTAAQLASYAESLGLFGQKINIGSYYGDLYYDELYYEFSGGEFEVVGVIGSTSEYFYENTVGIFNSQEFDEMVAESRPESYYAYLSSDRILENFIDSCTGESKTNQKGILKNYALNMPFAGTIEGMAMTFKILSVVFFWMSIVLCVFAALLLLNFITASVTHKKKEIGILRAIGARKIDVMSIFLWEGILIGAIVLAISAVLVFGIVVVFNNLIGTLAGIPFTMLVMGIPTLFFMALICFATIALASILPSRRVAGMKPMDAIRSL